MHDFCFRTSTQLCQYVWDWVARIGWTEVFKGLEAGREADDCQHVGRVCTVKPTSVYAERAQACGARPGMRLIGRSPYTFGRARSCIADTQGGRPVWHS
jgi:hypothetical protein